MTKTTKIVLSVAGVFVLLCLIMVSFFVYMAMSAFRTEEVDQTQARAAFEEVRGKFPGVMPAFELRKGNEPTIVRQPPAAAASPEPTSVHILAWDPAEGQLARITLPFSLLKMSNDPVEFGGVSLDMEDVQRYGRTLLLDGDSGDGDRILVWTD
jgi:hypothetical protein